MTERRDKASAGQFHVADSTRPSLEPLPGKFRSPTKSLNEWLQKALDPETRPGVRTDSIDNQ